MSDYDEIWDLCYGAKFLQGRVWALQKQIEELSRQCSHISTYATKVFKLLSEEVSYGKENYKAKGTYC